jgi:hypothetical protein
VLSRIFFHLQRNSFILLLKRYIKSSCLLYIKLYNNNVFHALQFPHLWFVTGFVTKLTRRVSPVEQELPTLAEYLSSPPVFSGIRVAWILVLCLCFVDRCLSFCTFSFGYCVLCLWFMDSDYLPFVSSRSSYCILLEIQLL